MPKSLIYILYKYILSSSCPVTSVMVSFTVQISDHLLHYTSLSSSECASRLLKTAGQSTLEEPPLPLPDPLVQSFGTVWIRTTEQEISTLGKIFRELTWPFIQKHSVQITSHVNCSEIVWSTQDKFSGYEGVIEKLIDYGADPFKKDASQRTARAVAAGPIFSKSSCVDMLLKYGISI